MYPFKVRTWGDWAREFRTHPYVDAFLLIVITELLILGTVQSTINWLLK